MNTTPSYIFNTVSEEAEAAESAEILQSINSLKDDDLIISSCEQITV